MQVSRPLLPNQVGTPKLVVSDYGKNPRYRGATKGVFVVRFYFFIRALHLDNVDCRNYLLEFNWSYPSLGSSGVSRIYSNGIYSAP